MNVKTMAAIVGTLSLGALATGCATAKPAAASTEAKGSESACKGSAAATTEKGAEQSCKSKAASSTESGGQMSCGASGCGGASNPK